MNPDPPRQMFDIRDRPAGIPSTKVTNELVAAIRTLQPYIRTGQSDDPAPRGTSATSGEFQWQDYTMVSANQPGWDDDRFTAVLEDG